MLNLIKEFDLNKKQSYLKIKCSIFKVDMVK